MIEIKLTQGYVALIDDEDLGLIIQHKWRIKKKEHSNYAVTHIRKNGRQTTMSMHRLILRALPGHHVDHANHNGLDNRRSNLRIATRAQNTGNQRQRVDNKSGVKGVCWYAPKNKWRANITISGKQKFLGYYSDKYEAGRAYAEAATEVFGEFAYIPTQELRP